MNLRPQSERNSFWSEHAPSNVIAGMVAQCVLIEGPVHVDRVCRVVAASWRFRQIDQSVASQLMKGAYAAINRGGIRRDGDFLLPADMTPEQIPIRNGGPTGSLRSIHEVFLAEMEGAVMIALGKQTTVHIGEVIRQSASILGYDSKRTDVEAAIRKAIDSLAAKGRIRRN